MPAASWRRELDVNKREVVRLLDSLADFHAIPRSGLDLAATLAANAQRAQLEAERRFAVSLTYDERGIKELSALLSSMHCAVRPRGIASLVGRKISFRSSVLIANTFGAFLGETMRRQLGGEWRLIDFNNQTLVSLYFDERNWSLPTYKAGKHFMNGQEDDVMFFYQVFVEKRSPSGLKNALIITQADIEKGQDHLTDLLARHEQAKKDNIGK
jgi:hypothetical protein